MTNELQLAREYRKQAEDLLKRSDAQVESKQSALMIDMAATYERMAEQLEEMHRLAPKAIDSSRRSWGRMASDDLNFDAVEFRQMPRGQKIRIARALAARACGVADLNPVEGSLQYVRIAMAWDGLADTLEEDDALS